MRVPLHHRLLARGCGGLAAGQELTATMPEQNATLSGVTVTNVGICTG
jgi:hypothetical protein